MKARLKVCDHLTINDQHHLHVKRVEVFTGDDDYNETDLIEIEAVNNKLVAKKLLTDAVKPSKYRIRNEPGVRIVIGTEHGNEFELSITHHKGSLMVDTRQLDSDEAPMLVAGHGSDYEGLA